PFIVVSGAIGEEVAVGAMKSGAHDYILKSSLARLVPAVERELRDVQVRRQRKLAEEDLRTSREQLRALAAHLQSVREEERKRITREIHDGSGLDSESRAVRRGCAVAPNAPGQDWRDGYAAGRHRRSRAKTLHRVA